MNYQDYFQDMWKHYLKVKGLKKVDWFVLQSFKSWIAGYFASDEYDLVSAEVVKLGKKYHIL